MYTGEFFLPSDADQHMLETYQIDIASLKETWEQNIKAVLSEATLSIPETSWFQKGGKTGTHTEKLGFLLADLQFMQRAYPNMNW